MPCRPVLPPVVRSEAIGRTRLLTKRTCGTNGWMSLWGSNAHGEIAGCPPSPAPRPTRS